MELNEPSAKYLVKAECSQTDVGLVPSDWLLKTIGDLFRFEGGSQPDRSHFVGSPRPGYVRLIQIRDYKSDRFVVFIPRCLARRFCNSTDIMIGRYGPPVFQILRGLTGAYNVALIKAIPDATLDSRYAYQFLKQDSLFAFIDKLSQRSSGQTGVDLKELRSYPLSLPATPVERLAIADALTDADALIDSLEQLLAKKRQIKQGAMQELLTSQRRLPGWQQEWAIKPMSELFDFSGGVSASRDQLGTAGHAYLHYGDIHVSNKNYVHVTTEWPDLPKLDVPLNKVGAGALLNDGDVVFVDASEDDEGTSKHMVVVNPKQLPFISGLHTIVAKPKTGELVDLYKRYCFQTTAVKEQFRFFAVGTKVSGVSKTNIRKISILVPPPEEQTAIATILSDMDTEITALEARLTKARQIKQGMAQALLTGRIRLVN